MYAFNTIAVLKMLIDNIYYQLCNLMIIDMFICLSER